MIYGYARVSTDGQSLAAQVEQLTEAGAEKVFRETASGAQSDRPQLRRALAKLDRDDVFLVARLDRLARSTRDLLNTLATISTKGASFRSLGDAWADTTTAHGRLILTVLGGLAEFERELIIERTKAGMAAARARGRNGGRPYKMTAAKLRLAMASMGQKETRVGDLCTELGITRQTLYRHVGPYGSLRPDGTKLLGSGKPTTAKHSRVSRIL